MTIHKRYAELCKKGKKPTMYLDADHQVCFCVKRFDPDSGLETAEAHYQVNETELMVRRDALQEELKAIFQLLSDIQSYRRSS